MSFSGVIAIFFCYYEYIICHIVKIPKNSKFKVQIVWWWYSRIVRISDAILLDFSLKPQLLYMLSSRRQIWLILSNIASAVSLFRNEALLNVGRVQCDFPINFYTFFLDQVIKASFYQYNHETYIYIYICWNFNVYIVGYAFYTQFNFCWQSQRGKLDNENKIREINQINNKSDETWKWPLSWLWPRRRGIYSNKSLRNVGWLARFCLNSLQSLN